eukprot:10904273-Ditylum_brightwellii.AAC.1
MLACELGREGCVRSLLSFGSKVSKKDLHGGNTALHYCARSGDTSSLRLLLQCRHDEGKGGGNGGGGGGGNKRNDSILYAKNARGETPVHIACAAGRTDVLEIILTLCPAASARALSIMDECGRTPLVSAVESGSNDAVMHLLMWRGNHRLAIASGLNSDARPNCSAIKAGGKNRTVQEEGGRKQRCPLVAAVSTSSIEMIQLVLEFSDPHASAVSAGYDAQGAFLEAIYLHDVESI